MIFNTNVGFDVQTKDVKYLEAGIHENVKLVSARIAQSSNGNNFIEFLFDKNGAKTTHTEYEPKKYGDETDESLQSKVDGQVSRIIQILKCFYKKELLNYTADSFMSFGGWVVALVNNAPDIKLRVKIVYNDSGFAGLPRYSKYTFIEPMTVSDSDSKIVKLGIDRFERPVADKEEPAESAASVFSTGANTHISQDQPKSDLPF